MVVVTVSVVVYGCCEATGAGGVDADDETVGMVGVTDTHVVESEVFEACVIVAVEATTVTTELDWLREGDGAAEPFGVTVGDSVPVTTV